MRVKYLDVVKGVAILLVILSHSYQFMLNTEELNHNLLCLLISSLNMPLFMLLSGVFFKKSLKKDFVQVLKGKGQQLLLPICFVSVIMLCVQWPAVSEFGIKGFCKILYNNLSGSVLWFLNSLFGIFMISFICCKKREKSGGIIAFVITIILSLIFINSYIIRTMWCLLPFFLVGAYWQGLKESGNKDIYILLLAIGAYMILFPFWSFGMTFYESGIKNSIWYLPWNPNAKWYIPLIRFIIGLAGSTFVILLVKLIYKENKITEFIARIGRNTLGLYVLQSLFFLSGSHTGIFEYMRRYANEYNNLFIWVVSILLLLFCLFLIELIKKNKWSSIFILGTK